MSDILFNVLIYCFLLYILCGMIACFLRVMQLFQQFGYHAKPTFRRIANENAGELLTLLVCFPFYFRLRKRSKKRLVFTHRVMRMCVTAGVIVLGAMLGVVFAPVAARALICVILALSVNYLPMIANLINIPIEKGIQRHYINDAKRIIDGLPNLITIGITGSYGKTSAKFFLTKMLQSRYNTLMTPESYNTTMGVVKTVRNELTAAHEVFICEMGAKKVGEIKEICDIVRPKWGLLTSIGPQHLETFGSIGNVIATKFELIDSLPPNGSAILNFNNPHILGHTLRDDLINLTFGTENSDVFADNISVSPSGMRFALHFPDNKTIECETRLLGAHNAENICGAAAAAWKLGVPLEAIALAVSRLEPVPHRLQLIESGADIIIDDAFNSNPAGAKSAAETLGGFDPGKYTRILITPGMIELGEKSYELNQAFGGQAAKHCDYALLIGERQTQPVNDGLIAAGFDKNRLKVFDTVTNAVDFARRINTNGKKRVILLENDLPDSYS
jgi:UDP-N-acetylmuramoyl-tripeptide--D-alanyl-D-alanine ligase